MSPEEIPVGLPTQLPSHPVASAHTDTAHYGMGAPVFSGRCKLRVSERLERIRC